MKILYRYLAFNIIKNFLALVGVFSIVIVSSQLLHLPSIIYHATFIDFLKVLILVNFSFFKFILLFGFFISSALVGYSLRENREIYAIYSAGISQNQILKPVFFLSFLFVIIAFFTSLWVVPSANRERAEFLTFSVRQYFLEAIQEKNFTELSKKTLVYVGSRENDKFQNIFFFNKGNKQIITSREAYFKGLNLHLKDGYIQIPTANGMNLIIFKDDKFAVDIDYLKNYEIEDFENRKLFETMRKSADSRYKALSVLVERFFFPVPFLFMGVLGLLIGLKTVKGKDYVLALIIGISIIYIVLNFYLLKLISKGSLNPVIYIVVITAYFSSLTYYFYKK